MLNDNYQQAILNPFTSVTLPLQHFSSGKVREIFEVNENKLLLVTTDRLSAFDRVLGAVPYKGQVLNQLSAWWFEKTAEVISNHMLDIPDPNAMLSVKVDPFPVEVIVRGYITGVTSTALWHRYSLGERVIYGHHFPDGLYKNQALPEPIITPTTKGGITGHDERLTCDEVHSKGYLDMKTWQIIQEAALNVFKLGQAVANQAGLILVDTKYEFGRAPDGQVMLIDEVHTPDSSRYWVSDSYESRLSSGDEPENYDKEFLRLEYARAGYRGDGNPPEMPRDLWIKVVDRYISLFEKLTGDSLNLANYPITPRLIANLESKNILINRG